jgi:hypothetical protein
MNKLLKDNNIILIIIGCLLFVCFITYSKSNKQKQISYPPDKIHLNEEYNLSSVKQLSTLIKKIEDSLPNFKHIIPQSANYFVNWEKRFNIHKNILTDITNNTGHIRIIPVKNPNTITVYATFVGNLGIIKIIATTNTVTHQDTTIYSTENNKYKRKKISNSYVFDMLDQYMSTNMKNRFR